MLNLRESYNQSGREWTRTLCKLVLGRKLTATVKVLQSPNKKERMQSLDSILDGKSYPSLEIYFPDAGVEICEDGVTVLGTPIGNPSHIESYIVGLNDAQVAYTTLTRSIQHKLTYLKRSSLCRNYPSLEIYFPDAGVEICEDGVTVLGTPIENPSHIECYIGTTIASISNSLK
ncbi:hypothetical protein GJ496_004735 [Pomphorhynchus laevis]|nr:hypothetical protein GJ496_004735 [Pomphorhynchus laevis]